MVRKAEEVYREAMALSETEREELVRLLTKSGGSDFASPEIEQAWIEEAERSYQAVREGREELISGDVVMRELREIVGK